MVLPLMINATVFKLYQYHININTSEKADPFIFCFFHSNFVNKSIYTPKWIIVETEYKISDFLLVNFLVVNSSEIDYKLITCIEYDNEYFFSYKDVSTTMKYLLLIHLFILLPVIWQLGNWRTVVISNKVNKGALKM